VTRTGATSRGRAGRLEGKVAVVTGGARGIGRAIAEGMAREGAATVVADKVLVEADGEGAIADAYQVDVSVRSEVEGLVDEVATRHGPPTVLVCCAGIISVAEPQGVLELTDAEWDGIINVNLRGTFLCAQAVARRLVAEGRPGSIITVSSIGASRPALGAPAYHASKGGVVGLTRALAVNLAPHGIRANCLAPGYVLTDMTRDGLEETEKLVVDRIPLRRMGDPEDLAPAAIYFASDESAYVTGQVHFVDGGALVLGWTPAAAGPAAPGEG
jgi:glucose 1-dehydrogenase